VTEAQYPTPISNNVLGQLVQVSPSLKKPAKMTRSKVADTQGQMQYGAAAGPRGSTLQDEYGFGNYFAPPVS